jgi:hypothetical protein
MSIFQGFLSPTGSDFGLIGAACYYVIEITNKRTGRASDLGNRQRFSVFAACYRCLLADRCLFPLPT